MILIYGFFNCKNWECYKDFNTSKPAVRWNIIRTITYLKWDINYPLHYVNIKFLKNFLFWESVGRPTLGEPIYNINNLRVQEIIFARESVRNIPYARRIDSRVVNASAVPRLHGRNMFTELSGEMSATRISITGAGAGAGRGGEGVFWARQLTRATPVSVARKCWGLQVQE